MPEAENESPYQRVSLEDAVADAQVKRSLSALDEPWHPQKVRLRIASSLAVGLLILFGLTIACSGTAIIGLVIASIVSGKTTSDPLAGIKQVTEFVAMLLPYIATPLGVALGYFFRQTQNE